MSLTREEWIELWESTIKLEHIIIYSNVRIHRKVYENHIKLLKEKIQSVIGQME